MWDVGGRGFSDIGDTKKEEVGKKLEKWDLGITHHMSSHSFSQYTISYSNAGIATEITFSLIISINIYSNRIHLAIEYMYNV